MTRLFSASKTISATRRIDPTPHPPTGSPYRSCGMRYYIAYGSNMNVAQMARRCPDATPVGIATLNDYKLVFRVHATIEPEPGSQVPVLVWRISDRDEASLDRYEGYPKYYYKEHLTVTARSLRTGKIKDLPVMVYIMDADGLGRDITPPTPEYYLTIKDGYKRFGFDKDILNDALYDSINYDPEDQPRQN